jgi:multiple sugar transport system permease protein
MVVTSFLPKRALFTGISLIPFSHSTLNTYAELFVSKPLLRWLKNTFLVASFSTIGAILLGSFGAYGLSRFKYRGKRLSIGMILFTQMLPYVLLMLPLYIIFTYLKITDTLIGLIIGNTAFYLPVAIWMLKAYFDTIPREIEFAAMVDGCSRMEVIFRILFPLSLPGIAAIAIITFCYSWSDFLLAKTMINSEANWVLSLGLAAFKGEWYFEWNQMMGTAFIFSLPEIVLFLIAQKQILKGLTAGSVKQ